MDNSSSVFKFVYSLQNQTQKDIQMMYGYSDENIKSMENVTFKMLKDIGIAINDITIRSLFELAVNYSK